FSVSFFFFFQAEDGIRDFHVTGVQTCALPISRRLASRHRDGGRGQPGRRHVSTVMLTTAATPTTTMIERSTNGGSRRPKRAPIVDRKSVVVGKECGRRWGPDAATNRRGDRRST